MQGYINGSAVRKEEYYEISQRSFSEKRASKRKLEGALYIDLPALVVTVLVIAVALFICINYLKVQSSITTTMKNISAQESLLEELKSDNDALETRVNTSVNLDYVYKVATTRLGMVYANKDQVITYNRSNNGYVRQYDDIQ